MIVSGGIRTVAVLSATKVEFIVVTRRRRRPTLAGELFVLQLAIIVVVLVAIAAVSLAQSEATFEHVEGRRVGAVAEQVAASPLVRTHLDQPDQHDGLATIGHAVVAQAGVTMVTFAEPDLTVRVSTDPTSEEQRLPVGHPRVAAGGSWSGTLVLEGRDYLVSQVPVLAGDDDRDPTTASRAGDHLGTVMVAERMPSTPARIHGTSSYLFTYLGTALVVGLGSSWLLSRRIKRQTLGLEPREIAELAEHREAMLRGIAEGVVALDPQHRITLVNEVARHLLDLPEHAIGTSVAELPIDGRLREVLVGAGPRAPSTADVQGHTTAALDEVVIRHGKVLVMSTMRVVSGDRALGTVTTMRDRTALADLEREIGSVRSTAHVLRAQAHEFANQLHTISGLIQIGEHDEVVRYVDALSERRHAFDLTVTTLVPDPTVAALLMAKAATATERRIELTITEDSRLDRLTARDAADVATVLGNLVDNALDHASVGSAGSPFVRVRIRQDASTVEIDVSDSGPGVAEHLRSALFEHGVTTKRVDPLEHGVGLALTRQVCRRRGGEIKVRQVDGSTTFAARLGVSTFVDPDAAVPAAQRMAAAEPESPTAPADPALR
ncbi:MAG: ATP-binding protein [Dermatophilaceae bacterium]